MPDGTVSAFTINGRVNEKRSERPHDVDGENGAHMDGYDQLNRELGREADKDVTAAVRAIAIGREYRVTQILSSNGVAPRTRETAEILRAMHPKREEPLILPVPSGPQLSTTRADCHKKLLRSAGSIRAPIDGM